jgi:hypothetical protein
MSESEKQYQLLLRLPPPGMQGKYSVEEALHHRRSLREYRDEPVPLADMAQLLWAASGYHRVRRIADRTFGRALYPLEILLESGKIDNLPPGVGDTVPTVMSSCWF